MLTLLLLAACDTAANAPTFDGDVPFLEGEVLVQGNGDDVDQMNVEDENGLEESDFIAPINVKRLRIPEGKSVQSVVEKLSADGRVTFA